MKNIFDCDKKTKKYYSDEFILRPLDEQTKAEHEAVAEAAFRPITKIIPRPLFIIVSICFFIGLLALCVLTGIENKKELKIVLPVAIVGCVFIAFAVAVFIVYLIKLKRLFKDPTFIELSNKLEESAKLCYEKLGVPSDAEIVTVFTMPDKKMFTTDLKRIFKEGENLCFADPNAVYAVPLKDISVVLIDKRTVFVNNYPEFAPKLKRWGYGNAVERCRYSLTFKDYKEDYEILIPAFEHEKVMKYINPQD